jgi:hypothetical protein
MSVFTLIEDARSKALAAANCWYETPEAKALIAKVDAYERLADRWFCECNGVSIAFTEAATEAEDALDDLRRAAVDAAADTYGERNSDEWFEAWDAADDEAPPVRQVIQAARRSHAGDGYLEALAA